jgi:hypothetical protein
MKNRSTYDPEKDWARESLTDWTETTPKQALVFAIFIFVVSGIMIKLNVPDWVVGFLAISSILGAHAKATKKLREEVETLRDEIESLKK